MQFDCIVVGSGSAGSAVAGRLSEDTRNRVLVLDALGGATGIYDRLMCITSLVAGFLPTAHWSSGQPGKRKGHPQLGRDLLLRAAIGLERRGNLHHLLAQGWRDVEGHAACSRNAHRFNFGAA